MLKRFWNDESGAVTVDYVVFLGGVVWMGMTVVGDVARASMSLTDQVVERMSYSAIVADIYGAFGPDSVAQNAGVEGDAGSNPDNGSESGAGNPGNNKNVGNAGENPNGKGGWGSGDKGRSR